MTIKIWLSVLGCCCYEDCLWNSSIDGCVGFCGIQKYVALKVQKSAQHYTEAALDEITILKQIAEGDSDDSRGVVKLLDHFKHAGPNGSHVCMVFEYLGDNLLTLIKAYNYRGLPVHMVQQLARGILVGLEYLHHQLSIIHTDLKPENVLLLFPLDHTKDPRNSNYTKVEVPREREKLSMASGVKEKEKGNTSGLSKNQKKKAKRRAKRAGFHLDERERQDPEVEIESTKLEDIAQVSTEHPHPTDRLCNEEAGEVSEEQFDFKGSLLSATSELSKSGRSSALSEEFSRLDLRCKIVDLGNACWTYKQFTSDIQTRQYRCPEVLLGSKYSTSADMWSFACIVFELATGDVLFDPRSGDDFDRDEVGIKTTFSDNGLRRIMSLRVSNLCIQCNGDVNNKCGRLFSSVTNYFKIFAGSLGAYDGIARPHASQGLCVLSLLST